MRVRVQSPSSLSPTTTGLGAHPQRSTMIPKNHQVGKFADTECPLRLSLLQRCGEGCLVMDMPAVNMVLHVVFSRGSCVALQENSECYFRISMNILFHFITWASRFRCMGFHAFRGAPDGGSACGQQGTGRSPGAWSPGSGPWRGWVSE